MIDDTRTSTEETADTEDEAEPTTGHDAAEGGILGAIGGAIVGGLAGGPVGALIGAVVGGMASAGAVEVIDKHDLAETSHGDAEPVESIDDQTDVVPVGSMIYQDDVVPLFHAASIVPVSSVDASTPSVDAPISFEHAPVTEDAPDPRAQIRERAFELYDHRGRGDGRDVEDWLEAEREVLHG